MYHWLPAEGVIDFFFSTPCLERIQWRTEALLYVKRQGRDTQCLSRLTQRRSDSSVVARQPGVDGIASALHSYSLTLTAAFFRAGDRPLEQRVFPPLWGGLQQTEGKHHFQPAGRRQVAGEVSVSLVYLKTCSYLINMHKNTCGLFV